MQPFVANIQINIQQTACANGPTATQQAPDKNDHIKLASWLVNNTNNFIKLVINYNA